MDPFEEPLLWIPLRNLGTLIDPFKEPLLWTPLRSLVASHEDFLCSGVPPSDSWLRLKDFGGKGLGFRV